MASPGFRMRWWMWLVAVCLILGSTVIALRLHGVAQLERVRADIAAIGLPADLAAWVAATPPVDRDRQQQALRVMNGIGAWPEKPGALPYAELQEQRPRPQDLATRDAMLVAGRSDAGSMARLLVDGPLQISFLGFIDRDPARLSAPTTSQILSQRIFVNLMACRGLAAWWATSACLADDPAPALLDLDRFATALDHPGSLIDAMSAIAVGAIQDQACLYLATRGRLPGPAASAWLAAETDRLRLVADGFTGERCLNLIYADMSLEEHLGIAASVTGHAPGLLDRAQLLPYWCLMPYDWASTISQLAGVEAELRGLPVPPVASAPLGMRGMFAMMIPNLLESAVTACEASYQARLHRVAAIIALQHRAGSALPADAAAAAVMIPAPLREGRDADHPAMDYERLGPARFRIGLSGGPPARAASRWGKGMASEMGAPASAKAWVRTRWSLEIDLDAILVPPPERAPRTSAP